MLNKSISLFCWGCDKASEWNATGYTCTVYRDPHKLVWYRQGNHCAFNRPKVEKAKKGFVNPLKASKRGRR